MKRNKIYDEFPKTTRRPKKGEVWLAFFPYYQRGGFEKLRPVLIKSVRGDEAIVQKITSKKKGKEITLNYNNKKSYLVNNFARIKLYKCYHRIKSKL